MKKYTTYKSLTNPQKYVVTNDSGCSGIGYEPYVIEGTKKECDEFCKKWNK